MAPEREEELNLENLIRITIRSTNYYLIDTGSGKLMVDAGWAGSLPALAGQLKRYGSSLQEIRYLMVTHLHPDHAGLAQEIKQASQARLILLEKQVPYLEELEAFYAGKGIYMPMRVEAGDLVLTSYNRFELNQLGIRGEIIETPGHSDDSVSLVLDSGMAFTGDLQLPVHVPDRDRELTCRSWEALLKLGASVIYPAHGNPFHSEDLQGALEICKSSL
jgi:endoribonuclease LACTB2